MPPAAAVLTDAFAAMDRHDLDGLGALVRPDCVFAAPGGVSGDRTAFLAWVGPLLAAVPDVRHDLVTTIESAEGVAAEVVVTGTHARPLRTPEGEVPATGRPIHNEAVAVAATENGQLTRLRIYFDKAALFAQFGVSHVGAR